MLLLLLDSLLLIVITTSLGILSLTGLTWLFGSIAPDQSASVRIPSDRPRGLRIVSDLPGVFLMGLILSTIYFNIISFWLPVNYLSLIPLLALSGWIYSCHRQEYRRLFFPVLPRVGDAFLSRGRWHAMRPHLLPLGCTLLLLCCYWIKPSTSPDSRGYHFLAIAWYEKFKVVPGLGNLHGRLAFNPVSFIIGAAYSLTGLTGQSIYPLNGVITVLFLLWILARVLKYKNSWTGLVYSLLLVLLFRPLLAYMSSPSSDPLVMICIAYPAIRLFELLLSREKLTLSAIIVPLLVICYAPLAKLSAYPVLPLLVCIFFLLPLADRRASRIIPFLLIAACIYLPWLGRNYILSGYLAYPVPHTDLFHPDWKIPADMLQLDYLNGKYSARSAVNTLQDFLRLERLPFRRWFIPLLSFKWQIKAYVELLLLLTLMVSPLTWLLTYKRKKKLSLRAFLFWLTLYAGAWIWVVVSIDFRFGMIFPILSFIFSLLMLASAADRPRTHPGTGIASLLVSLLLVVSTLYYLDGAVHLFKDYVEERQRPITADEAWLLPLKDAKAYLPNDQKDFPYTVLHNGVKLFLTDSCRSCTNGEMPCEIRDYGWWLGKVEMRGTRLDQGFKNVGIVSQKEHPF
jgi:hypothetical protein